MAIRYCGNIRIRVAWSDERSDYRCTLSADGKHIATVYVGAPACLEKPVDCPEAYDETAHAALSFAYDDAHPVQPDEQWSIEWYGAWPEALEDGSGWQISRKARS